MAQKTPEELQQIQQGIALQAQAALDTALGALTRKVTTQTLQIRAFDAYVQELEAEIERLTSAPEKTTLHAVPDHQAEEPA